MGMAALDPVRLRLTDTAFLGFQVNVIFVETASLNLMKYVMTHPKGMVKDVPQIAYPFLIHGYVREVQRQHLHNVNPRTEMDSLLVGKNVTTPILLTTMAAPQLESSMMDTPAKVSPQFVSNVGTETCFQMRLVMTGTSNQMTDAQILAKLSLDGNAMETLLFVLKQIQKKRKILFKEQIGPQMLYKQAQLQLLH